ncbi:hypothetical protein IscW_ISCW018695 [Ixodes scapularis]|uniref:Uncharacterized protein n=1 Tax=Ixodes scapularis TaxID=6945 RepID=B7PNQ5_IXOSC|nr:hypothetical protein IscW_ISCW018695 [Ixodes scapularis]|eukprot:XP_002435397.1 hypothetical protein IscW_ISCW018695 [Ixodes scapularis]
MSCVVMALSLVFATTVKTAPAAKDKATSASTSGQDGASSASTNDSVVSGNASAVSDNRTNERTLGAFLELTSASPVVALVSVSGPGLLDLRKDSGLSERFAKAAVRWLSLRGLRGLAFLDYSSDSGNLAEFAPPLEAAALDWMSALSEQTVCFALTLAAVAFRKAPNASCADARSVSFMKVRSALRPVCNWASWVVGPGGDGTLLRGDVLGFFETPRLIAQKVSLALSRSPGACVAALDVDGDDYEGACGAPAFDRLRAVRRAQGADAAWATSLPLTPSLPAVGDAETPPAGPDYLSGLKSPGALVLVAVHERALAGPLDGLVRSTARQLKSGQLDGLALLHASPSTALVLKAFRSTYLAEDLCLLASIRLSDDQTSSASGGKLLRELSAHLDLVVIDTHHGGGEGPCRAVAAASLNRPLSGCRPQVAVRTALSWMQEAGASLRAAACFSVDMRVFRYHTYGPGVLDGPCHSEEQLRYERVCRQAAWSFARDDYSVTQVGRDDEGALLSFETPDTLRDKVLSASRGRPSVCVAVFNYDYEDFGGHCHDEPYARLRALRAALGAKEARDTGGAEPTRALVCLVSGSARLVSDLPPRHCTHLVLAGAGFDLERGQLLVPDAVGRLRRLWPGSGEAFLGLEDERLTEWLLAAGAEAGLKLSTGAAPTLREHGFGGLALLRLNRTSTRLAALSAALPVMRQVFGNDLQIIVSLDVLDSAVPASLLASRLEEVVRYASLVVFQTHYTGHDGYCEPAFPSTFDMANSVGTVSVTCDEKGWASMEDPGGLLCVSRRRGDLWQAFESEALLGAKVERALRRYPTACVALFDVDLDASACPSGRHFGRLAAVAESKLFGVGLKEGLDGPTPGVSSHRSPPAYYTVGATRRVPEAEVVTRTCARHNTKSDVCTSVSEGRPRRVPPKKARWKRAPLADRPPSELLGQRERSGRPAYLARVSRLPQSDEERRAFLEWKADGVALLDQSVPSTALPALETRLRAFRKFLGSNTFLVLGLEIPDFDDKPSEVADRLRPLLELLDVLVLQTHLTRRWDFCRTAYPSVLRDSEDGCSQSVPMLSAVRWMELLRTRRPICLSVNMAALRFRLAGRPGSNSACTGFAETNQPCDEARGWHLGHEQQWAHCGVRHTADLWESYEVPDLLEQKVKVVMAAHSATCWAVFNADLDASSETCNQESFARLKNTWKAGGYSEEAGFIDEKGIDFVSSPRSVFPKRNRTPFSCEWSKETLGRQAADESAARKLGYATTANRGPARAERLPLFPGPETGPVVCVFDRVPDSMALPPGLCGTVVYAGVAYSAQHHSLLAEDEGDLDAFVTLRKAEAPVLLVAGVRSSSLPERWTSSAQRTRAWAAQAAAWLRLKRLDGMALLLGRWPRRVSLLRVFLQEVLDVFGTSQSPGKLRLILGVPPHQKITDLLTVVTEAVDTLIFTGHHESPAAACRVAEPSSPASGDDPLAVLVEATASMKTLRAEVRTQLRMCFSVNLAVLSFARDRSTLTVGDSCVEEMASDYAETCPVKDGTRVEGALSCLALNSTHVQTFEDERTIATKVAPRCPARGAPNPSRVVSQVGFLRQQFPDACVAAFHVEREDSRRACPERVPFSRLAAIRTSLAAAAVPSISGPIVADSGKQLVAAGFLLCVLSEFGMGLASFPAELCSHVIFTGLGYDVNESSVRVKNESVFKEFLALGERTRIVAAVDNSAVAEPSDVLRQAFAETVCNWLAKHAMAGLAVLRGAHADLEQTWELLQVGSSTAPAGRST